MSGWDQRWDIEHWSPRDVPRWLKIYLMVIALGVAVFGIVSLAHADSGEVSETADRGERRQVTPTIPPPSTREIVNALPYQHYNDGPAMEAFRWVAAERGWTPTRIAIWQPFVRDVMLGESAFCWNRRRGDIVASYSACVITRQGTHEDVGFGQVTTAWYGQDAILCTKYGVCSSRQILASPYDSMLYSIVIPIEEAGSQSWCFNSRARAYHDCWLAPDR